MNQCNLSRFLQQGRREFGSANADGKNVAAHYTDTIRPSGVVNTIFACAKTASCTSCLQ